MRNLFLFIIITLFASNSFAQQACNDDIIMNVKGNWKKSPDFHINPKVISRIDIMQQLLQAAYPQPKGNITKELKNNNQVITIHI